MEKLFKKKLPTKNIGNVNPYTARVCREKLVVFTRSQIWKKLPTKNIRSIYEEYNKEYFTSLTTL